MASLIVKEAAYFSLAPIFCPVRFPPHLLPRRRDLFFYRQKLMRSKLFTGLLSKSFQLAREMCASFRHTLCFLPPIAYVETLCLWLSLCFLDFEFKSEI